MPHRLSVYWFTMGENFQAINSFLDLVFSYGTFWVYLAILVACFIENIFPPFPGDSFIAVSGALAALHRLDFTLSLIIVIAGGMSSVMAIYYFGKNRGREFFLRKNYKYFSADDIHEVDQKFKKYGALILLFSRFVVGFRSALALVAGMGRVGLGPMLIFSTISYFLFSGLIMYLSYKLVANLEQVQSYFKTYNLILWPIIIILIGWFVIYKVRKVRNSNR